MRSLRRWLLVALLGALLLAGIVASVATYVSARDEVDRLLDEELRQVALSLRDHARLDLSRLESVSSDPKQRVLVQIWDPAFERPYSSQISEPMPRQTSEGYATIEHAGRTWRVYTTFALKQTVQVAQPTSLRGELAARTAARLLIPVLIVLPILGLVGWWIVGRGLAPISTTAVALASRDPNSLDPLASDGLPIELRPLVDALNGLLGKLAQSFDVQRRFAADAAHELRTPLTALTLQVQMAQRATTEAERERALGRLEEGVKRASRLVQQLLTMARLDPQASEHPFTDVDLSALAASVVEEFRPLADQRSIELKLDANPSVAVGQEDALRILLNNLVDNAIRYTPAGGTATVSCGTAIEHNEATLEVNDSGPGIPLDQRSRAFDRFFRGDVPAGSGTGLGLAIARQIVALHRGRIELDSSKFGGLRVEVGLPNARTISPAA
jgi:two-component system OmpR family sensor kinase